MSNFVILLGKVGNYNFFLSIIENLYCQRHLHCAKKNSVTKNGFRVLLTLFDNKSVFKAKPQRSQISVEFRRAKLLKMVSSKTACLLILVISMAAMSEALYCATCMGPSAHCAKRENQGTLLCLGAEDCVTIESAPGHVIKGCLSTDLCNISDKCKGCSNENLCNSNTTLATVN